VGRPRKAHPRPGRLGLIPKDVVHASFNVGAAEAKVVAILGPCKGDIGYEVVEMGAEAPWNTMRG
jgi:hypothetical protein